LEPQQQAREQQQVPLASLPQDRALLWWVLPVPLAAQQAQRAPVKHLESLELLSAQPEPPQDVLRAVVPRVHVPPVHQKLGPRVSPEPRLLHAARAALAPLLPPILLRRARHRLPLRRRQHPSNGAGPSPQLRRGSNWNAFSFPLRQTPLEGQ
jgi:hypothetical protein